MPASTRAPQAGAARLLVLLGFLVASSLSAQQTGAIQGWVQDSAGTPLSGATVELLSDGRSLQRVPSDDTGRFHFEDLAAGTYRVRADHIGYRRLEQDVVVRAGARSTVRLMLGVSPVEIEGLQITIPPVDIDPNKTDFGSSMTKKEIDLLPAPVTTAELVTFTPGARAGQVWGGATAQANNYQIDGLPANNPGLGGELVEPSVRWIEKVDVLGLGAAAEYGNFQGGLVNVTTKSGSNDFTATLHTSVESDVLSASNLGRNEIGAIDHTRTYLDAELGGPVVRNRLFFFLGGQRMDRDRRFLQHLPEVDGKWATPDQNRTEDKLFGKLTWVPAQNDVIEISGAAFETRANNFGTIGYEGPGAALQLTAPTRFGTASWKHNWGSIATLDLRLAGFRNDERRDPYNGVDTPGLEMFSYGPPYQHYVNAPLRYRYFAESRTAAGALTLNFATFGARHRVKLGGEYSLGAYIDQRKRDGAVTWRPVRRSTFDPADPATWAFSAGPRTFLPVTVGGEVDLDSNVENDAVYIQDEMDFGRLKLSPGLRGGRWVGMLTPAGGERFTAVRDQALDPRFGAIYDLSGDNSFVVKAHWGRYHQSMFAQFFDRAAGGHVFTDQEMYYYWSPDLSNPDETLSRQAIDSLVAAGQMTLEERIRLNESGPVVDYHQPYIDQWLVGMEKMFYKRRWKFTGVYINRRNRDMVGLVDRNLDSNWTAFDRVGVLLSGGEKLQYQGLPLVLKKLYIPNDVLIDYLRLAAAEPEGYPLPPGMTPDDTLSLSWNPDYVLTNIPQAQRKFDQLQFTLQTAQPTWGASASWVWTWLRGNLDNVAGYEEKTLYDDPYYYNAGPWVHPNGQVNAYGPLEHSSRWQWKLSIYGALKGGFSGGAYWTWGSGDHYTPYYEMNTILNLYRDIWGNPVPLGLISGVTGERVKVEERGRIQYHDRSNLDVHLERPFALRGSVVAVSLDVFNLFNFGTITRWNESVNKGQDYLGALVGYRSNDDPNRYYLAPWERVQPRTIRLGTEVRF